jgi:hypothetical protein
MTDATLTIISLFLSGLTLLAVLALVTLVYHANRRHSAREESYIAGLSKVQELVSTVLPNTGDSQQFDSVLARLTFKESIDSGLFAFVCQDCALDQINSKLKTQAGDGISITVNALSLHKSTVELTVSVSKQGQKLLADGKAVIARHSGSGQSLPILRDSSNGKIVEMLKGSPTKSALSRLGAMSGTVIGAAHIVSGADIAKRLKIVDEKVNLLLAYRQIDHLARLERIYSAARELARGPITSDKQWELWRLRGELREMRCSWRRELEHRLSSIDDAESAPFLSRLLRRQVSKDRAVHAKVTEGELQLQLIEYTMRLEHVIAAEIGMVEQYELSLADELEALRNVANLLRNKARLISESHPELSAQPMVQAMDSIVKDYALLLPVEP